MKKIFFFITAFFFLVVAGLIISAPFLIENQKVQEQILRRLNSVYLVNAEVKEITFTWLPLPHLKMTQLVVRHEDFSATSPQAIFYPSWKLPFGFSSLGHLQLLDPLFQLHRFQAMALGVEALSLDLPEVKLQIQNGTLRLPGQQNGLGNTQQVSLGNISASLAVHGSRTTFSWQSDASFAEHLEFTGEFGEKGEGTLQGEVRELDLQKIAAQPSATLVSPLADPSTFSFLLKKKGAGTHLNLQGEIPDFSLTRLGATEDFRLGKGDLQLQLDSANRFSLLINDLVFLQPRLQISGEIARYVPAAQEEAHIKIDLQAQDVDLTAVRQPVLSLLGDSSVARLVGDIVQRAQVNSASYFFDAPVPAFADIRAMTIAVDIAAADIHLAAIPLDLKNAQGPILIKDGVLTGRDITTWVGDAKGTQGAFLVGLAPDKHGLEVDVDINANLQELPAVLRTVIDHQEVVAELERIQGSGRASAHLRIGDDLRDFHVLVAVDKYEDAEVRYERLPWPLRLESGDLRVSDTSVTWKNIKAHMAAHTIRETSGHAAWDDQTIPLSIDSLRLFLDANTLWGEVRHYPLLTEAVTGLVDSIQGSVEVTGTLSGPFFRPTEYRYSFDTKVKDLLFSTPALPTEIAVEKGHGTIGHQEITIAASSGSLFGHKIHLSGNLVHDHWQKWAVNLQTNGLFAEEHFNWLTSKDILPDLFIPRLPYRVETMHIRWDDELFNLTGKLFSADDTTSLELEIKEQADLFSTTFQVKNQADKASLALQWQEENETLSAAFQGNISGTSLQALVDAGSLSFDTLSGDFKLLKKQEGKTAKVDLDFNGTLQGRNIQWPWSRDKTLFTIPTLDLVGEGPLLQIKELQADFNQESLTARGSFSSQPGAGHFELDLTAPPSLTTTNIEQFQKNLDHFLSTIQDDKKEEGIWSGYEISALLNFDCDRFIVPFGTPQKIGEPLYPYQLPFTPLKGSYHFSKTASALHLQQSKVCDVEVNGQLSWQGPKETSKELFLSTPADTALNFEDFLSCFNFDRFIEGPLHISGRIYSDTTLCKGGGLLISSQKGKIKRFVALAKTLSLINITGLSGAIWTEGFYYNALEISGNICDNIFTIEKAFIDGDGVNIIATGEINLTTMEYDLTLFVVPFSTITGLVTKVPLVGRVLGGKEGRIISVPVKVTGPLNDPDINFISPSAIGEATRAWILDTITLPFDWMVPEQQE